ncbi:MAG: winged helix-turn-helix domain-containing protein [Pseudomonadota bacterium]
MIFRFETFELDLEKRELRDAGEVQASEPQVLRLLEFLITNRHRVVSKDDLTEHVWEGRFVSDSVINSRISTARGLIGDDGKAQRLIKTLHRQGFRFVGDVTGDEAAPVQVVSEPKPIIEEQIAPPSTKPSIAILPFRLVGVAGPHAGIAEALPYELISELSRMRWLRVIARGTSFQFRESDPDVVAIGKQLNIRYCLTGLVEVMGSSINVIVEVAETENANIVWSQHFRSDVGGVHEIREQITSSVAASLEVHIPLNEARAARLKPAENLDAWGVYHLGLQHLYRFTRDDNDQAAALFRRAIELEPDLARAHAALSSTEYYNARTHYTDDYAACVKRCRDHAEKSLEIDGLDPYANYAMGRAFTAAGDLEMCASWYDRTLAIRPNYAQCLYSIALNDTLTEAADQGQAHIDDALTLSPLDPFLCAMYSVRAFSHIIRGEYQDAARWGEKVMATPNVHPHYACIPVISHTMNGDMDRASVWYEKLMTNFPGSSHRDFFASFPFQDGAVKDRITDAFFVHENKHAF